MRRVLRGAVGAVVLLVSSSAVAQGTRSDYLRAERFLGDEIRKLAFDGQVDPHWIGRTTRFWYVNEGPEGKTFMLADAAQGTRSPAFDHQRLAQGLSTASGSTYAARELPFPSIRLAANAVAFKVGRNAYRCDLGSYQCAKTTDVVEDEDDVNAPPRQPDPTEQREPSVRRRIGGSSLSSAITISGCRSPRPVRKSS